MNFGPALLLLFALLAAAKSNFEPNANCDFNHTVIFGNLFTLTNPQWPGPYEPGVVCRWIFNCPEWYSCRVRCHDVGLPQTEDCYVDKFLVADDGNSQLEDADEYCGQTPINTKSSGNTLSLGLISGEESPGGRFRCTVRAEHDGSTKGSGHVIVDRSLLLS